MNKGPTCRNIISEDILILIRLRKYLKKNWNCLRFANFVYLEI